MVYNGSMQQLFVTFNPGSPTSTYTLRNVERLAFSGMPIFFASVLRPKDLEPARKPFLSTLVQFTEIFRDRKILYYSAPETNPWAAPRQLKVPQLPTPPFYTFPPPRSFGPKKLDLDEFEPAPLMREMAEERPKPVKNSAAALARAATFPMKGILRQDPSGFVYLAVSPEFAKTITESGCEPLKPFISIMLPHEVRSKQGWGAIRELGSEFSFSLVGVYSVEPANWPKKEQVWFYTVHSPELSFLRQKYLHPNWRSFHLTVGTKARRTKQGSDVLYRLNVSCHAA